MRRVSETLATHFWRNVLTIGDAPALHSQLDHKLVSLTWKQLAEVVYRWIGFLRQVQVSPDPCVATWLPNGVDWIAVDLACQTLGLAHFAIDRRDPESRMRMLVQQSGASIVISEPGISGDAGCSNNGMPPISASIMESLLTTAGQVLAHTPAQLLTTSGTSGRPKIVTLSHANLLSNAMAKLDAAPQLSSDLRLNILPFAHAYARTCELSTWIVSRSQLAIADNWDDWLEQAARLRPTLANLVPYLANSAAQELRASKRALGGNMRLLQVGGAGLSDELWYELSEFGLPPLQGYGLTEASPVVCSNRAGEQRAGTVGPPVSGAQLKVDAEGVLWTRGPQVMLGYWKDPAATALAIRDGWLRTGDFAELTSHGLRIIGRQSDQIVLSTGYKVSPAEVEARLCSHSWIEQAVVVGRDRSFVSALVWPCLPKLPARLFSSEPRSIANLNREQFLSEVAKAVPSILEELPPHASPKSFSLLPEPLSLAAGTLTRKGVPARAAFER